MQIFLFDIDGVLVAPRGYRQGIWTLLEKYAAQWNFKGCLPGEREIALLESVQITSEWDQIPICLACMLEAGLSSHSGENDFSLDDVPQRIFLGLSNDGGPDYREKIQAIAALPRDGRAISAVLLETGEVFPRLFQRSVYAELFGYTRDVRRSRVTRSFQTLELGNRAFQDTYQMPAEFEAEGLLMTHDRALLSGRSAAGLLRRRARGDLRIATITARPSLPDGLGPNEKYGYSPEANLALRVAGLADIPCIGFGELSWLAGQLRLEADSLLKPNRYHALAGILAACGLAGREAVREAYFLHQPGLDAGKILDVLKATPGEPLEVNVFEDTPVGVISVRAAVERLNKSGIPAVAHAWGITQNADKSAALEAAGAAVFPSIQEALAAALPGWEA